MASISALPEHLQLKILGLVAPAATTARVASAAPAPPAASERDEDGAAADGVATIDMTLTSAACPLTDVIEEQTRSALTGGGSGNGLVDDIKINWVWMPPWGPDKITEDGREQLRALGFRV